jgi:hypothetical protein
VKSSRSLNTPSSWTRIWSLLRVVAVLAGLCVVPACVSTTPTSPVGVRLAAPLSTSWTTSTGTWAIAPMGHLSDPLNTFWELLFRPDRASSWALVTPRGVADNGGLVATTGLDPTVTVGFLPNQNLLFSPLARTSDNGTTWSPGLISDALVSAPDVLAGSNGGGAYALVISGGGRVLATTTSNITTWRTLVTQRVLAKTPSGRSCDIGRLTALTADDSGHPLIGTTCSRGDMVGIFGIRKGRWELMGPHISGGSDSTISTVLRLLMTGSGVSSLLTIDDSGHTNIVAAWRGGGSGPWKVSSNLAIHSSERIVSTAINQAGGFLVETTGPTGSTRLSEIASRAANWQTLPSPPVGTKVVVAGTDGAIDALSVNNSKLTDWELSTPNGVWRRRQTIDVPIEYGSSD